MIDFFYRDFTEWKWPIYNWEEESLKWTMEPQSTKERYHKNKDYMMEVEAVLPPKKVIKFSIPLKDEWEEDLSFQKLLLNDIKIDPKTRVLMNNLLKDYYFCHGWFFVKRTTSVHDKMNTKQMESLQIMKDQILGNIRTGPLHLDYIIGKWSKRERIQTDFPIHQDEKLTYYVGNKKYTTTVFWSYTRTLRAAMFDGSMYDFYWWHDLQYCQRLFDLNYWATNFWLACRFLGKTQYSLWNNIHPLFKSPTLLSEISDEANLKTHFFVPTQRVIPNFSKKIVWFFNNFLIKRCGMSPDAAEQIYNLRSDNALHLYIDGSDRVMEFVSQASENRWERSQRSIIDEADHIPWYEKLMTTVSNSWAWSIHSISTIWEDSKSSPFYQKYVDTMIKQQDLKPIEEVIHYVHTKYWFDKITDIKEYEKFIRNRTFSKARNEFYKLRPYYAQKSTIDEVEWMTEDDKQVRIEQTINSAWHRWMIAELYCEPHSVDPAIPYRSALIDPEKLPTMYEKVFVWYDEADSSDKAWLVVIWMNRWKLYVIEAHILPNITAERYQYMREVMWRLAKISIAKPSMIVDIWRWPIYFTQTSENVKYVDMAIKARSWYSEDIKNTWGLSHYSVGTRTLVENVIKSDLIETSTLFFSTLLAQDVEVKTPHWIKIFDSLLTQMDNYVLENGSYRGKNKKIDDLVSAMLYAAYYAYNSWIKEKAISQETTRENFTDIMNQKKFNQSHIQSQKPKRSSMWRSFW